MSNVSRAEAGLAAQNVTVSFGERFQASAQFDGVFKQGMALVERTAAYLEGPGRTEAKRLPAAVNVLYASESMRLTTRLLERQGFRVSGYTDARAALAAARAHPDRFDLAVTDYNMPGMSGLDVAREVRAIRADLPVAVASGFIDEVLRAQAGGAGVRELILKADAVDDFCAVVQRLAQAVTPENS